MSVCAVYSDATHTRQALYRPSDDNGKPVDSSAADTEDLMFVEESLFPSTLNSCTFYMVCPSENAYGN